MAFDHGQAGTKAWGNMLASAHKFDPILYVAGIVEEHWVVMLVAVFGFFLVIINQRHGHATYWWRLIHFTVTKQRTFEYTRS